MMAFEFKKCDALMIKNRFSDKIQNGGQIENAGKFVFTSNKFHSSFNSNDATNFLMSFKRKSRRGNI